MARRYNAPTVTPHRAFPRRFSPRLWPRHAPRTALALACAVLLALVTAATAWAASRPPLAVEHGLVASGHPLASAAGVAVLEDGGNAVDAAVATALTLDVVAPYAGVLGGGGFMLIYVAESQEIVVIDFRELAPAAATRDMYLDADGDVVPDLSTIGYKAVAVPGGVAGLALATQRYGTLSFRQLLRPAIEHARRGFPVSPHLHEAIASNREVIARDPEAASILLTRAGAPPPVGSTLKQPQLARTLRRLARGGWQEFYRGRVAHAIADDMAEHGGLITLEDLAAYRPTLRRPIHGTYRGYDVWSMPPPSSGGVHIVQMLNVLEGDDLAAWGFGSSAYIHHLAETMKLAYADRAKHLGDPAFYDVPVRGLTSKAYAAALREQIDPARARPSDEIQAGDPARYESPNTVHLSVMDRWGNAVALTQTLNTNFGARVVAGDTGIFLNNEMDDFSAKPGVPNVYGLVGGEANAIQPGKIPLSSMSPTIVTKDGRPVLVLGSPGGSTIITAVLQTIVNVIDFGMDIQEAVDAPRVHDQWLPPILFAERFALAPDVRAALEARGHTIEVRGVMGDVQAIYVDPATGRLTGAADPRREGGVAGY